jgi:transketolase
MQVTKSVVIAARKRLLKMHFESGVGHIGGNLSCLDAMLLIHHEYITDADRFILSKGHSAGAFYTALWSTDKLTDGDLAQFHKDNTLLAGHPPAAGIKEILFATGSLGHGLSLAGGTAQALKLQGKDGRVFCLTSDGEWQEGSTWEALIFASHHCLSNLIVLVDHNRLQGFGDTSEVASMAPLQNKLVGFNVDIHVVDGHDLASIRQAIELPQTRTRIIVMNTVKGKGVSFMENQMQWHYLPLKPDQYQQAIGELNSLERSL